MKYIYFILENTNNSYKKLKKAEWIEAMVYSQPSAAGKQDWLAVGSHDNTIYLLDT